MTFLEDKRQGFNNDIQTFYLYVFEIINHCQYLR